MIKAVIFDFFGVLALSDSASFRQTFYPNDPEKTRQTREFQDKLDMGEIGYDDFINELAKLGGVNRDEVLKHTEQYQPNRPLLSYIRDTLKPKYKIGIISNAGSDWVMRILGDANKQLFDDIVLSYKVAVIKPQPDIYKMSVKNLGVEATECVFVDDILTYCKGAEAVGMKTIWYKNYGQAIGGLEKVLAAGSDN